MLAESESDLRKLNETLSNPNESWKYRWQNSVSFKGMKFEIFDPLMFFLLRNADLESYLHDLYSPKCPTVLKVGLKIFLRNNFNGSKLPSSLSLFRSKNEFHVTKLNTA